MRLLRLLHVAFLCLLACLVSSRVHAQEGAPVSTGSYSIDLTQGPVLSASRVTGLSGAVAAIAEGVEGGLSNPAAAAVRTPGSVDFWDYWVALSVTYPFQNGDFYNSGNFLDQSGKGGPSNFFFLNTGAYLQLYGLGFGMDIEILEVDVRSSSDKNALLRLQLITNHVQMGYLFLDGQLAIGGGLQILRERAIANDTERDREKLGAHVGFGAELGALLRPNGSQWRVGAGLYSVVKTQYSRVPQSDFALPKYAVRPWRGSIGGAYQFGKRPLNPRFRYVDEYAHQPLRELAERKQAAEYEHVERRKLLERDRTIGGLARLALEEKEFKEQELVFDAEEAAIRKAAWRELRAGVRRVWERRYILLIGEVSLNGRVANGVGIESFLAQIEQRSGEKITVSPRLAIESEVWPTHVKVRAGSYYEPSRFRETSARIHGTFGVDVRLFRWDVFRIWPEDYLWQLTSAIDISRDYQAFSLGFGGWY